MNLATRSVWRDMAKSVCLYRTELCGYWLNCDRTFESQELLPGGGPKMVLELGPPPISIDTARHNGNLARSKTRVKVARNIRLSAKTNVLPSLHGAIRWVHLVGAVAELQPLLSLPKLGYSALVYPGREGRQPTPLTVGLSKPKSHQEPWKLLQTREPIVRYFEVRRP